MGMAASQARFLSITARLSNLEFEGQQINQARMNIANLSEQAATEYQQAMSNRRLLFDPLRQVYNDKNNYQVFTYDSIVNSVEEGGLGMRLVDRNGKIIVPAIPSEVEGTAEEINYIVDDKIYDSHYLELGLREKGWNLQKANYVKAATSWKEYDLISSCTNRFAATFDNWSEADKTSFKYEFCNYERVTNMQDTAGYCFRYVDSDGNVVTPSLDENVNDEDYVYDMLTSGEWSVQMGTKTTTGNIFSWSNADWRSTEGIYDILDTTDDGVATAKFEKLKAKYQKQDKELELRQKQIDSEHSALQTEYDAVKKVIDKNVETSFRTFG